MTKYDKRHGGPYDRGGADYWYGRPFKPHYYTGDTYQSILVPEYGMSKEAIEEYRAGYREAEARGDQKDWG